MNYPGGPFSFVSDHRQQSIRAENEKKMMLPGQHHFNGVDR